MTKWTIDQEPAAAPPPTELERVKAELHLMKTAGAIEVAIRNPSVSEYMGHWEGRALNAETRIEALEAENSALRAALVSADEGLNFLHLYPAEAEAKT